MTRLLPSQVVPAVHVRLFAMHEPRLPSLKSLKFLRTPSRQNVTSQGYHHQQMMCEKQHQQLSGPKMHLIRHKFKNAQTLAFTVFSFQIVLR